MREVGVREGTPVRADQHHKAMVASANGDVAALAQLLPSLLRSSAGPAFVEVAYMTMFQLRYLGYVDLAREAARLGVAAARESGDHAALGVAKFAQVHSLSDSAGAAAKVAREAADELQPWIGNPDVRQAYGMLHLSAALREAAIGDSSAARDHLSEAAAEAGALGEPRGLGLAMLGFGPTNVGIWRMTINAELADWDGVLRTADAVSPQCLGVAHRQAVYQIERGRALVGARRDNEAVAAFLRAEEIAPQYVRVQPTVRDAVSAIVVRARRGAISRPLRRLAAALDLQA